MRACSGHRQGSLDPYGRLAGALLDSLLRGGCARAESEQIWLAAFKIEFENSEMERARGILAKARATLANERIWMKSALVERERGETEEARRPVHTAGLGHHAVCNAPDPRIGNCVMNE